MKTSTTAQIFDLAEGQFGCVTDTQAAPYGGLHYLLNEGIAERISNGVVHIRAGGRHPHLRIYAAWLELGATVPAWNRDIPSSGVISGASALKLYTAGDLPGEGIEILTGQRAQGLAESKWRPLAGLPVTTAGRTLADLSDRLDIDDLVRCAQSMLAGGWVTTNGLHTQLVYQVQNRQDLTVSDRWVEAIYSNLARYE